MNCRMAGHLQKILSADYQFKKITKINQNKKFKTESYNQRSDTLIITKELVLRTCHTSWYSVNI